VFRPKSGGLSILVAIALHLSFPPATDAESAYLTDWSKFTSLRYQHTINGKEARPQELRKVGETEQRGVYWSKIFRGDSTVNPQTATNQFFYERSGENGIEILVGTNATPTLVLPNPVSNGTKWAYEVNGIAYTAECELIKTLRLGNRSYTDVAKVTVQPSAGQGSGRTTWYAAGIGMIQDEVIHGTSKSSILLAEMENAPALSASKLIGLWQNPSDGSTLEFRADAQAVLETAGAITPIMGTWGYIAGGEGVIKLETQSDGRSQRQELTPEFSSEEMIRLSDSNGWYELNRVRAGLKAEPLVGGWSRSISGDRISTNAIVTRAIDGSAIAEELHVNHARKTFTRKSRPFRWKILGRYYVEVAAEETPLLYASVKLDGDELSYRNAQKKPDEAVVEHRSVSGRIPEPPTGFNSVPYDQFWRDESYENTLSAANRHFRNGALNDALAGAQNAVKLNVDRFEAHALAAVVLLSGNELDGAQAAMKEALARVPVEQKSGLQEVGKLIDGALAKRAAVKGPELSRGDARKWGALQLIYHEAQRAANARDQQRLLWEFLASSAEFSREQQDFTPVWLMRASVAAKVDYVWGGYLAGKALKRLGLEDSEDPTVSRVFLELERKGWLANDKVTHRNWTGWTQARLETAALEGDIECMIKLNTPEWTAAAATAGDARAYYGLAGKATVGPDKIGYYHKAALSEDWRGMNGLAWHYATTKNPADRNEAEAIKWGLRCVSMYRTPSHLDTLAAAYASAGDFANAVKLQEEAITGLKSDKERTDYTSRLNLYREKKPYREN